MDETCVHCRSELSAYVDGQLESQTQTEFTAHIGNCELCSDELSRLKLLKQLLSEHMAPEKVSMPELWPAIECSLPSVCELIEEDLSAYLDNELPVGAQEGVKRHIKECLPCMSAFKEINETSRLLAKSLELPLSIKVDLLAGCKVSLKRRLRLDSK